MGYYLKQKTIVDVAHQLRILNKKVVFTHGTFDLFHAGHSYFLNQSKKEGDILIFEEREGKVYIRRVKSFFDFEGSLPSLKLSIEEIREKAMDEMAKEAVDV